MEQIFRCDNRIGWNREKLIIAMFVCVREYHIFLDKIKKDLKSSLFTAPCRPIGDVG